MIVRADSARARGVTTAPTCVIARAEKGFIQVYNNCSTWQRVKVVMAFDLDKGCKSVEPGTRMNVGVVTGRIDRIENC